MEIEKQKRIELQQREEKNKLEIEKQRKNNSIEQIIVNIPSNKSSYKKNIRLSFEKKNEKFNKIKETISFITENLIILIIEKLKSLNPKILNNFKFKKLKEEKSENDDKIKSIKNSDLKTSYDLLIENF
jgi:hypothetical protein